MYKFIIHRKPTPTFLSTDQTFLLDPINLNEDSTVNDTESNDNAIGFIAVSNSQPNLESTQWRSNIERETFEDLRNWEEHSSNTSILAFLSLIYIKTFSNVQKRSHLR